MSIWSMLVRSGPGLCTSIYRSTLVLIHISSMFCFLQGSSQHGIMRVMVGFGSSMTCVLFHLQISLSIVKQQVTTGITHLVSWLGSSTACCGRSSKDLHCLLWSSGMTMCCQITPNFLQLLIGSFWPGNGCWKPSTRLGVHICSENSNVTPVDFWKSSRPPCYRLWLAVWEVDRVRAVSVRRSLSGVTIMRHCICWVFCSMVFWIVDGSRAVRSRLAGLNTSPSFRSNDSWSALRRGAALTLVMSCRFVRRMLVSVLVNICLKYILWPIW